MKSQLKINANTHSQMQTGKPEVMQCNNMHTVLNMQINDFSATVSMQN